MLQFRKWHLIVVATLALFGVLVVGLALRLSKADDHLSEVLPRRAGTYDLGLTIGIDQRTYRLHLPGGFSQDASYPLVVVLHGGAGSAKNIEDTTRFTDKSDEEGFIVVYPNGSKDGKRRLLGGTWNAYHCCSYAYENNVDDVGFIRTLIDTLKARYNIDGGRIYVAGFSNGGMMAYRLVEELPGTFAAGAFVSASIGGTDGVNSSEIKRITSVDPPVSVAIFHGRQDDNVKYDGGISEGLSEARIDLSVQDAVDFWAANNRCDTVPGTSANESGNIETEDFQCADAREVLLYSIADQGHAWPGDSGWKKSARRFITDKPTAEISATDIIWEFFKKNGQ